ncbi:MULTISPECIES: hypothetical protein [unclassified Coleofasciculus]|nr:MULTISPECIES: hypothetical protein [unclassified Coleofasciculus]MBE9125622.1 hypothetical protein [Coleofasciculus sp. LEGE 07081]MBE9147336.1 hypothetical protein [Coleofasciculus sp. LEGE 07092]
MRRHPSPLSTVLFTIRYTLTLYRPTANPKTGKESRVFWNESYAMIATVG